MPKIAKRLNGKLLHVNDNILFRAIGFTIFKSDDNGTTWKSCIRLPVRFCDRLFAAVPLLQRLLRKSIYHLMVHDDLMVIFANKESFIYRNNQLISRTRLNGSRPLIVCTTPSGEMYYGDYILNYSTNKICIHKISPQKSQWETVWVFENVRHIHGVFHDPFSDSLWVTTGDYGTEVGIWRTDDGFQSLKQIIGGNQQFRAVQLLFTEDYVFFGSDTPLEMNYLYRMDRNGDHVEALAHVNSSVFYGCKVDNSLFFSTSVEPSKINLTKHVDIWRSDNGRDWYKFLSFKKDFLSMRYFQYGHVTFPAGNMRKTLFCTPFATDGSNKTFVIPLDSSHHQTALPNKLLKYFHTLKYLKQKQIFYRLYYLLRSRLRRFTKFHYVMRLPSHSVTLHFLPSISFMTEKKDDKCFTFLNRTHCFESSIDWNEKKFGKLWTYNLTYFEYLNGVSVDPHIGLNLINDFIKNMDQIKDGMEPFPISLRSINWIKFLTTQQIRNQQIDDALYAGYMILADHLEYHLLGNHLLENGFSLLFGAYYFQNDFLYSLATKILSTELQEQILPDGAHFELSPMYHQIMLYRILDCINLIKHNTWKRDSLLNRLEVSAADMTGWLLQISFQSGAIPLMNDSANGIAPTTDELLQYAKRLKIDPNERLLRESGYRKIKNQAYECVIDVGNIGPDYIPGHAHSDTFNFELYVHNRPFIVDTGTSTYETNVLRQSERSTAAHNTVMVNGIEQSEVWGGFRVARRAKVFDLSESSSTFSATHDGYKRIGALHTRHFDFSEHTIIIRDNVESSETYTSTAFFHFHPDVSIDLANGIVQADNAVLTFSGHILNITTKMYHYAPRFNTLIPAKVVLIEFKQNLKTEIIL